MKILKNCSCNSKKQCACCYNCRENVQTTEANQKIMVIKIVQMNAKTMKKERLRSFEEAKRGPKYHLECLTLPFHRSLQA